MHCWICGSSSRVLWKPRNLPKRLSCDDLTITDKRYGSTLELWRCGSCGFIYANGEEVAELVVLYEQIEDQGYQDTQDTRTLQMRWLVEESLKEAPKAHTLVDIGAGTGLLVDQAKQHGLTAVGVEPSHKLVEAGRQQFGVDLLQGIVPHPQLEGRTFDLVFLVDVIEHVSDPVEMLAAARGLLSPGGLMVVVTPDVSSLAARAMGRSWWHLRPAHVGYFSKKTFSHAAQKAGLQVIRMRRALWVFPVWYLTERLSKYLPLGRFNQWVQRQSGLGRLYRHKIYLNLRDSWVYYLKSS